MEEIKVGEYVRTDDGRIYQVDSLDNEWLLSDELYNRIVKHSPNIIDLIEVGDYVNGELVTGIFDIVNNHTEEVIGKRLATEYRTAQYTGLDNRYYIHAMQIKSIVTKEQFKSMEYRLED